MNTELVLLNEEDYPEELANFLAELRELDAAGGPHYARVNRGEVERFCSILEASVKRSGQVQRRGAPPAGHQPGPRKVGRRKTSGMREE